MPPTAFESGPTSRSVMPQESSSSSKARSGRADYQQINARGILPSRRAVVSYAGRRQKQLVLPEKSGRHRFRSTTGDVGLTRSRAVAKGIAEALATDGFRTRTSSILMKAICSDVSGWVGLNVTSRDKVVEANVVVGVRSEKLELFINQLMGEPIFGKFAPTISIHIGYLTPEATYRPWFFDTEPDRPTIDAIAASVRQYALPFMEENSSLCSLAERLRDPIVAHHDQAIYRLPSCYWLLGSRNIAVELCDEYEKTLEGRQDAAAEQYRRFATKLHAALDIYDR